jgi:hypothetical protein
MPFKDKTQFDYLFDALAQKYPGIAAADGVTSNFQFMETPKSASWVTGFSADAFYLANSTSLRLDGFFSPGNNLANAYQDYVQSIKPSAGSDNVDYQTAMRKVSAADGALTAKASEAMAAYNVFIANNPKLTLSYPDWLASPIYGGDAFFDQLNQLRAARNDQAALMTKIVKAIDGPLAAAQLAVNPWSETMNISDGGAVRTVPLVTIGGDLAGDKARWVNYRDNEFDFDVTITADDVIKTPWKTTYETHTSFDPCYGMSSSTTINSQRIIEDANYQLRVSAVGVNTYDIHRGQWFHESLIIPTQQIVDGSAFTNDSFFGYNGALHLIPEQLLVMYRPTIVLTVSTDVYKEEIEGSVNAGLDWVDIFGFHFDMKAGASLTKVQDQVKTTITIQAPADQAPQIIGVISKVAWNQKSPSAQSLRTVRQAYAAALTKLAA